MTSRPSAQQVLLLFACLFFLCAFDVFLQKTNRTVSVSADKMNVFYVGVDNPITVAVAGVPSEKVAVGSDDVKVISLGDGRYNVVANKPGVAALLVHGEGFETKEMLFRVKRIPDPVAVIDVPGMGWLYHGEISAEEFSKAQGVKPLLENFEFETKMEIVEFTVTWVPQRGDAMEFVNKGANFNERVKRLIEQAAPGDKYYFDKITVAMEGSQGGTPLKVNSMVFKIK